MVQGEIQRIDSALEGSLWVSLPFRPLGHAVPSWSATPPAGVRRIRPPAAVASGTGRCEGGERP